LPTFEAGTPAAFKPAILKAKSADRNRLSGEETNSGHGMACSQSRLQRDARNRAAGNLMLTITTAAAARLARMFADRRAPQHMAVRLRCTGSQLAFESSNEQPGDVKFFHDGSVVLLVDADSARLLEDEVLDAEGPRLLFQRGPRAR
jgi:Fe-S cluster assembly iron-binding protein IscA